MKGGAPQHVCNRADVDIVEAEQARVVCLVIAHGNSSLPHDAVQSQIDGLKLAKLVKYTRDTSLWDALYPGPLAPVGHNVLLRKS